MSVFSTREGVTLRKSQRKDTRRPCDIRTFVLYYSQGHLLMPPDPPVPILLELMFGEAAPAALVVPLRLALAVPPPGSGLPGPRQPISHLPR